MNTTPASVPDKTTFPFPRMLVSKPVTKLPIRFYNKILFIGCSDCYAHPHALTCTEPEQVLCVMNWGNKVIPAEEVLGPQNLKDTILAPLEMFGIEDIIVYGHTDCAVLTDAILDNPQQDSAELPAETRFSNAAEINVVLQMHNLMTHPEIIAKVSQHQLNIHGWVFDAQKGTILMVDDDLKAFKPVVTLD